MSPETPYFYDFGGFRLDLAEKVLLRDGKFIPVTPKVFETLQVFVENAGRLIEKDELMRQIWQERFVEESNLTFNIKMLRKALGDNAAMPRFIETVPKRGYRFIAEVEKITGETVSKNGAARQTVFQPIENNSAVTDSPKSKKFFAPIIAVCVLLIGAIAVGSWYVQSKNLQTAPILSAPFALEKLSTNGKVNSAAISPDGKTVVYTNSSSGRQSVWLRQLDSGNNVEIIPPSDHAYYEIVFSPNGLFIYFIRRTKGIGELAKIYRVSIFGGIPTKIVDEVQGWLSVSPDGAKISFVRCYYREDENCSLWIADSMDGKTERKLASRPRPFRIGDNQISPDGKRVVFAVGQSENAANEFGLMEVDLETGAERELTAQKFFNIRNLSWLPDESGLLITASRVPNKHFRIWQISAATGEALPLTKDSETYSALSTDKEAKTIVSTQIKEDFRLSLFQFKNATAGRVLANATELTFAPDGKIIFSSGMSGNDEIWSMSADGSEQRQLTNTAADEIAPVVSFDNNSIFFGSNRTGEMHVWRMNADGSNQTQITRKEGGKPIFVSPDGRWIYYQHGISKTLWRASAGGEEEQMILNKEKYRFAFSPDGLQFAYSEKQGKEKFIIIASTADGRIIKTVKYPDSEARMPQLVWLPDGNGFAYVLTDNEYKNSTLWLHYFNADGEEKPQQIAAYGDDEISHLAFSPDGKSFAVVQGDWKHDAVLLKGLK